MANGSILDFVKKTGNGSSSSSATQSRESPSKPRSIDTGEGTFRRSTKTLVKSTNSSRSSSINDDKIEDEDFTLTRKRTKALVIEENVSPIKASPVKKSKESPMKQSSPVKSPEQQSSNASKKFNYREYMQRKHTVPTALGQKEIPEPNNPTCLLGVTFVFTGDLSALTRDMAADLVKRCGGRVTSAPSKKTDFVVVGENPGPSKMEKIEALGLRVLVEDEFLELIRSKSANDHTDAKANAPNDQNDAKATRISSRVEKEKPLPERLIAAPKEKSAPLVILRSNSMWTDKYAPKSITELIGNHGIYEKLASWLSSWTPKAEHRAVLISGPPGIGKTTMARLAARETNHRLVEMNASDTRSKKTLHEEVREMLSSSSISAKQRTDSERKVLVMDEVDGMSAGDRGGMAELILLIKKTKIPIICICNDRASPKVRSLANYCLDLRLRRPDARMIVPRVQEIAREEGLAVDPNTIEELVASTQADIRQILMLLSTYRLTHANLTFDDSKRMAGQAGRKDVETGPFDAVHALLSGGSYERMSLAERIDQYFVDGSLVPLMLQENYLRCRANNSRTIVGKMTPSFVDLMAASAESISQGDLVESLIRGANQEWSLAPLHGVMSTVLPAYYCHGILSGRVEFSTWLGQYSKGSKNQRLLGELSRHTYLHTHADKIDMRLDYLHGLATRTVHGLKESGGDPIGAVIQLMAAYSMTREDLDTTVGLCLDPLCGSEAFGKIPTATRSALTRRYNQSGILLPYSLGQPAVSKRISIGDEEEVETEEVDNEAIEDAEEDGEEDLVKSLAKDKMIKAKPASTKRSASDGDVGVPKRGRGRGGKK